MSLGMGASMLGLGGAEAAAEDYKALVCINLGGGNDGMNMIVPFDDVTYQEYAALRTSALALPKSGLTQLSNDFAMNAAMASLLPAWQDGAMAVMHNIGTLSRPLTKDQFWAWWGVKDSTYVPDGMMSHPGSGALWQTGGGDDRWQSSVNVGVSASGWAARALDILQGHSVISAGGSPLLGSSAKSFALSVPSSPANPGFSIGHWSLPSYADSARQATMQQIAQIESSADHPMVRAYALAQQQNISYNANLGPVIAAPMSDNASNPELAGPFSAVAGADSYLVISQLFQVAKIIKARSLIGGKRHVFYVDMSCFDTHGAQAAQHLDYMRALGSGLSAFYAGMKALGLQNNVTAFTISDFGRTFPANGSGGTDHGWGSEHLVVGGAVDGGKFYGKYPQLVIGGPDDMSQTDGRWIPTQSHDQYAATLLKWFDASLDVNSIFTNLGNFGSPTLGFMKATA